MKKSWQNMGGRPIQKWGIHQTHQRMLLWFGKIQIVDDADTVDPASTSIFQLPELMRASRKSANCIANISSSGLRCHYRFANRVDSSQEFEKASNLRLKRGPMTSSTEHQCASEARDASHRARRCATPSTVCSSPGEDTPHVLATYVRRKK